MTIQYVTRLRYLPGKLHMDAVRRFTIVTVWGSVIVKILLT